MEKKKDFLGTYYSKELVLRLASIARLFSWIVAVFYAVQWLLQTSTFIIQFARGLWGGMGLTDYAQNILWLFEQPLRGLVYFVVLQGVAQAMLLFMDIEENTRRAARGPSGAK